MVHALSISYVGLEQLGVAIDHGEASEGFSFLVRIFDVFTRLVNNFKTSLLGFRRAFKRSELREFHESHRMAINQFFQTATLNINQQVPIPSGMKVSYLRAATELLKLYQLINIQATIAELLAYFAEVDQSGHPLPAAATIKKISCVSKDGVEAELRLLFTADKTLTVPVHTVISTFSELVMVDQHVAAFEPIFQGVERISADLDEIEKAIDHLVTSLETQRGQIDRGTVQSLYQLVRTASVQLDMYGVVLAEMQRVEHNFVLVLRRLMDNSSHI
jgi:hypothetical protein